MKRIYLLIITSSVLILGTIKNYAQTNQDYKKDINEQTTMLSKDDKKAERAAKKAAIKEEDQMLFEQGVDALKNQSFAVIVDQIIFPRGVTKFISSSTNFVYMDKEKAVIQLSLSNYYSGRNGLGGITVEGTPSNIKFKTDKKGRVYYSFSNQGIAVSAIVNIQMLGNGNRASITISPNFNNNNVTLIGTIIPYEQSNLFQGRTI